MELENRVEELENKIPPSGSRVIDIREVTIEEAKRMIYEYLEGHNSQSIYPSEVADELGLDLEIAVKAIDELLGEEKLEVADR